MQEKKDTLPPQIVGGKGQTVRPAAGAFSLASGPPRRSSRRGIDRGPVLLRCC